MHRFYTPLLRRLYFFLAVFLAFYSAALLVQHSTWNKERLYRKLISGPRDAKLSAVADLVYLNGQEQLLRALKSRSPTVREMAANSLWNLWFHAAGHRAFAMVEAANQAIDRRAFPEALDLLTQLTDRYPKFAEGWNRRATLYWQMGRYRDSIADCRRVVALNPGHFGAWQGMGICQVHLGDLEGACDSFRMALKLNPHDYGLIEFLRRCEELLDRLSPRQTPRYDMV